MVQFAKNQPHYPSSYRSSVVYSKNINGDRQPGASAIEPSPHSHQAIRGSFYIVLELYAMNTDASTDDKNPAAYSAVDDNTHPQIGRISKHLLNIAQKAYYTGKGTLPQVLQQILEQVHLTLQTINKSRQQAPLRASLTCASLIQQRLNILSSGPALALIISDDAVEQFPSHEIPLELGMGGEMEPEGHIYSRNLQTGGILFLGSRSWLRLIPIRKLLGAVSGAEPDTGNDIIDYLAQQTNYLPLPSLLLILEAVGGQREEQLQESDPADPDGNRSNERSGSPATSRRHVAPGESKQSRTKSIYTGRQVPLHNLPTAVNAAPPVHDVPSQSTNRFQSNAPAPAQQQGQLTGKAINRDITDNDANSQLHTTSNPNKDDPMGQSSTEYRSEGLGTTPILKREIPPETPHTTGSNLQTGLEYEIASESRAIPLHSIKTPQKQNEPSTRQLFGRPTRPQEQAIWDRTGLDKLLQQIRKVGAAMVATVLPDRHVQTTEQSPQVPLDRPAMERFSEDLQYQASMAVNRDIFPGESQNIQSQQSVTFGRTATLQTFQPPQPATGSRARLYISIAVLLMVLVPIIVFALRWRQGASGRAQGHLLFTNAEAHAYSASAALDLGDKAAARTELTMAQESLREAALLLGNTAAINDLSLRIEKELQSVLQVKLLYKLVEPLAQFSVDASPHRLLVVDQDIYVLDQGRNQVLRYRLNETRESLLNPEGELILSEGSEIDSVSVGPLVDMTWQLPIPGIEDKANLLLLDANHRVFRYNQRVEGAGLLNFGSQETWQAPSQIESYFGRFYVADQGQGQIFRYQPGQYESEPEPWIRSVVPQGLAGLQAMVIDGDIWLLMGDGLLLRYRQGEQVAFALENDVGLVTEPVDLHIGEQDNSLVYVADAGQDRILVFSKEGTYLHQYQAAEGTPLQNLRSIYIDEVTAMIYILTKSSLFQHPLPQ